MSATVIIATIGNGDLYRAIDSVLKQQKTYPDTHAYVVCDGPQYAQKVLSVINQFKNDKLHFCVLPQNVGANGYYGHRTYAAFVNLVNTEYVLFLDGDNWFDEDHVSKCVNEIKTNGLDWCYSLRKIHNKNGEFLINDDCESLGKWQCFNGYHLVDTSCYCIKTPIAVQLSAAWHGGWGTDRRFFQLMAQYFAKFDCTGHYSLNYTLEGNAGSVQGQFFQHGNQLMKQHYGDNLPWKKQKS